MTDAHGGQVMNPLDASVPDESIEPDRATEARNASEAATRLRGHADPPAADAESDRGEADVWSGRTHWLHFSPTLIVWFLLNAVVGALLVLAVRRADWLAGGTATAVFGLIALLSTGELVGRRVLWRILGKRYRLTTERLFIETGVLSRTIDQTELVRVDDVRVHRSLLDRLFGLGTVEVVSTDATHADLRIEGIGESDRVAEAIRKHMRSLRRRSLYVENL